MKSHMAREPGSRGLWRLKGQHQHRHEVNCPPFRVFSERRWQFLRQRPRSAPRAHMAAPTATEIGPTLPQSHRRPLLGLLWVGWPLQWRAGTPRTPKRHQRGHSRPSAQQQRPAQTTAGGSPQRTKATPNFPQPPQGAGTPPLLHLATFGCLWVRRNSQGTKGGKSRDSQPPERQGTRHLFRLRVTGASAHS